MKSFKEYISEANFKIDIPDMPTVYVDAKSAGEVKKKLRAILKKPTDVQVTRVQPAKVKKAFRLRAQGKDEDEEEIKEGTWALPDTPKKKATLKKILSKPLPVGKDGDNASSVMGNIIGDDELMDDFYDISKKKGPKADGRPAVKAAMKRFRIKEEVELDEISRSMTPMRDRFGSGKKKLSLKDFKRGMFVITKKGEVGKIVANEPRADQVVVKMNRTKKEVEMNWRKLGLYTEPRLKGLVQAEALDKEDEPKVKEIIKKLKGASQAHAGQAKDLEKAVSEKRGRPRKDGTADGDLENIQMQLRKSVSLRGKKDVEFADGKKKKVDDKVARKVLQMIDKYRQSKDKQNIVNYIGKSEKNLMNFASGKAKDSDMDPDAKRKKLLGIK